MYFKTITPIKIYVTEEKEKLKKKIRQNQKKPSLVVIQVDSMQASNAYVKSKRRDAEELDIEFELVRIDSDECSQEEFENILKCYNAKKNVNGIIIQLPIPEMYDVTKLQNCISPEKDVDGFRKDSLFYPCTPKGIVDWLEYNNYNFSGKDAVVVGRSKIVGKPLVQMLIDKGATVTCCNSKTKRMKNKTRNADLVITAIGQSKFFDQSYFTRKTMIVDVGINRDENNEICGDIDRENCMKCFGEEDLYITAVPGGVGLLTRISLMKNTFKAFKIQQGVEEQ